jgi:hypothetical protein
MDKKDMMYMGAALVLVLVIAIVIKPMMTGQPVNTGIAAPVTTITVVPTPNVSTHIPIIVTTPVTNVTTRPPPTPTPAPTWNPNASTTLGFVDPSSYGVALNQSLPAGTRIDNVPLDTNMTTFATIKSDTGSSGTTSVMYIPFPYWELVYTVEPTSALKPVTVTATATQGTGLSYSGLSGSYSSANPQFTIQVMDGDDPNRIVRTISPPGGINLDLWTGVTPTTTHENSQFKTSQIKPVATTTTKAVDPRPWTEKFFEGQRHYFFIITAQSLDSYTIKIQIPTRYIGKY